MNAQNVRSGSAISRILLLGAGLILILSAFSYNHFFWALLDATDAADDATIGRVRTVRLVFLLSGLALICVAECVQRISWLAALMKRPLAAKLLLAALVLLLPLFILELALHPLVCSAREAKTTIFAEDDQRGWKLKPNAEDTWGGVRVKINAKGLRGPELDYAKPPGVYRILYLGDSVTFGYKLESHEQTFPYLIEAAFQKRLGRRVETINAGVGGYSPWQEYLFLSSEGIKYDPDLVVVCFVLNDVTEKFGLVKFGGTGRGLQLSRNVSTLAEKLLDRSSLLYCARLVYARMKYGKHVQQGAQRRQRLDVQSLVSHPQSQGVEQAWKVTLENLGKIFDSCETQDVPVVVCVFPFTFQFDDVDALSQPQRTVCRFALDRGVPAVDLLPILSRKLEQQQARPEDYFLDDDHLSRAGSKVVAEALAGFIQREGILALRQDRTVRLK